MIIKYLNLKLSFLILLNKIIIPYTNQMEAIIPLVNNIISVLTAIVANILNNDVILSVSTNNGLVPNQHIIPIIKITIDIIKRVLVVLFFILYLTLILLTPHFKKSDRSFDLSSGGSVDKHLHLPYAL